jgi:cytochrome c2
MILGSMLACVANMAVAADNPEHGRAVFEQCAACHSLEAGKNGLGPSLKGVFGRKAATVEDFIYSPAMRRSNVVWTAESLDEFLAEPQSGKFRGNKMPFSGMPTVQDRRDLIAFLKDAAK